MGKNEFQHVASLLDLLEDRTSRIEPLAAESMIEEVLERLFKLDDYALQSSVAVTNYRGIDFLATPTHSGERSSIGIEFKYHKAPAGIGIVQQAMGAAMMSGLSEFMIICTGGFSRDAHDALQRTQPIHLTLKTIQALRQWAEQLQVDDRSVDAIYDKLIRTLCEKLALEVARNPDFLERIEWRELEKMLAEVLGATGLVVNLTPPSKDGGKDIIVECWHKGVKNIYYVEIKHWRCGNRVGIAPVKEFVRVVFRDNINKGLFLSSSGYTDGVYEALSETEQRQVELGGRKEIIRLCKTYTKIRAGLWRPPKNLADVLFLGRDSLSPN